MEPFDRSDPRSDLIAIIRQVRRRWRTKLAVRGAARLLALLVGLFIVAAYALEWARFSPGSIITFRIVLFVALGGLAIYFMVRPLRRRVTDEQVAMYVEEHEPSLQAAIVSAVEASRMAETAETPHSAALVRRLVESAVEKCAAIDTGLGIERLPIKRYSAALAAIGLASVLLVLLGPTFLRSALSALLRVSQSAEAAAPYRIEVTPGHATVPKGADQTVTARLQGFQAEQATLMARKGPAAPFERLPLVPAQDGHFDGMLFDVAGPTDYYVEAAGVRSPIFTLKVVDLPYVKRLDLEYHFPAYMGVEPRKIEDGGDIVVPLGTEVRVRVFPTIPVSAGQLVLHENGAAPLTPSADGTLTTSFKADRDGFYRVELDGPNGQRATASPQYTIDILNDEAPTVSFVKPGRDKSASPIEEVFVQARAQDDYGIKNLELVYSVNGAAEKTLKLFDGTTRLEEVIAGHTFYLEELNVQPGDSVAYYARATDNDTVNGGNQATSDMYFMRVRPFGKEFRPAQSMSGGGGGGGGGAGDEVNALSEQQKQIIAATFNIQRDRKKLTAAKLRENTVVVALAQSRLREQVEGLLTRMNSRLVQQDPAFQKIADLLPLAVAQMKDSEAKLQAITPERALSPEQSALRYLQQAEEEYEVQVSMSKNGGGGGGGGGTSAMADELADLFQMELDKMANQYETVERSEQQTADQKMDELAEKLKELARRQEQEAERQRRQAAVGQAAAGGGDQQRQLAQQAEEAARELEKLSREQNKPELMDSARRLQEAADAMRKAAAGGSNGGAAQAAGALDRLRESERQLQRSQTDRIQRDVNDALKQGEELAREQAGVANDVGNLPEGANGRDDSVRQLTERKDALESKVDSLEKQIDRLTADASREEPDTSRKLSEAAGRIRDSRVKDKIRYSKAMIGGGAGRAATQSMEADIGSHLDAVRDKLRDAAGALGNGTRDTKNEALDKARRLASGLESLGDRTRERLARNGDGNQGGQEPNQNGQPGQGQQADGRSGQGQQPGDSQQGGQSGNSGQGQQSGQSGQGQSGQGQSGQGQSGQSQSGQGQSGQGQSGQGQSGQGQSGQGQSGQGQSGQNSQGGQSGQGQSGGQGQGSASGGGGNGNYGIGDARGWFNGGGGYGDRRPGRLNPEDIRQLRGEIRQWTNEAQDLRRMLRDEKIDPKELDELLKTLRSLDDEAVYQNPQELARLQTFVTEGAKRFEFGLRRRAEGEGNDVVLSGADQVPEQFRTQVEEYYRSLSKTQR